MAGSRLLAVVSTLPAAPLAGGRVVLTKKFIEGMTAYAEHWGDEVLAILDPASRPTDDLDRVEVEAAGLPFGIAVEPFAVERLLPHLRRAAVVLGGPHHKLPGLSAACRGLRVPVVSNVEYSLTTRLAIARATTPGPLGPLRLLRRAIWELREEVRCRREIRLARALQCNGTPAYEAYRGLCADTLLYFDSRAAAEEMASDEQLAAANRARLARGPLRLAFSGRLHPMKGVDDLVPLAAALRDRGTSFSLRVFGAGALEAGMRTAIARAGLEAHVRLEGAIDFHTRLLPLLREDIDLFVCCHPQGDPSCTYLETLSAGVPIVGYGNEAFAGLLREAPAVGWRVPTRDVRGLASAIARLDADRPALAAAAGAALAFARQHDFGRTFRRRVEHLRALARPSGLPCAGIESGCAGEEVERAFEAGDLRAHLFHPAPTGSRMESPREQRTVAMRLALLIAEFPTQTHIFFWRQIEQLRLAGVDVRLVSTRRPRGETCRHAFAEEAVRETLYLFPPRWARASLALAARPMRVARALSYIVGLRESSARARARCLGLALCAADLLVFCERERIEHLHVHSCADSAHVASLCRILGGPPFSLTLHGDLPVYGTDHESKMARAAFIACVARAHREQVIGRACVPEDRVIVNAMGVDTNRFVPDGRRRYVAGALLLATVARLHAGKGHRHALAALRRALDCGMDARYAIVGEGPHRSEIEAEVLRLGLEERVDLCGTLAEDDVIDLLQRADAFVLPSVGEAEPVAVKEAMSCGLPVVVSRVGGTPDMIDDGQDGLLVDPGDEAGLAQAFLSLAADPSARRRLGDAARRKAIARFGAGDAARELLRQIERTGRSA